MACPQYSTGLLADAFDMLADASGYAAAWIAIGRLRQIQEQTARWNGTIADRFGDRRGRRSDSPVHRRQRTARLVIFVFAALSLAVNGGVLVMLAITATPKMCI